MKIFYKVLFCIFLTVSQSVANEVKVFEFTEKELLELQVRKVRGADNNTLYSIGNNENGNFLKSVADNAASGLGKEIKIDLNKTPFINITWKIEKDLSGINENTKKAHDYAARVFVIKKTGATPLSNRAINYVFSSNNDVGFYSPSPICDTEELISEVLGGNLNEIMQGFDAAITPVVFASRDFLSLSPYSGTVYAKQILGRKPRRRTRRRAISPAAVKTSLSSGELQSSIVKLLATELGARRFRTSTNDARDFVQNPIEGLISILSSIPEIPSDGNLLDILLAAASIASDTPLFQTPGTLASFVDTTVDFLKTGDLRSGFSALANIVQGSDRKTLASIGSAFMAVRDGDVTGLVKSLGPLVGIDPELSNMVTEFIDDPSSVAFGLVDDLVGGLGAIGGIDFDVGSAMAFISAISSFFDCDPEPECSPNDTFTLQNGGSGKPGVERPNLINIGDAAIEKAENFEEGNLEIDARSERIPFRGPQRLEVVPFELDEGPDEEADGGET